MSQEPAPKDQGPLAPTVKYLRGPCKVDGHCPSNGVCVVKLAALLYAHLTTKKNKRGIIVTLQAPRKELGVFNMVNL